MVKVDYNTEAQEAQKTFLEVQPSLTIKGIVVNDQADVKNVQTMITGLKKIKRSLEEKRKSIVFPMDTAKKAVQSLFNPWKTKIDETIGKLETAIFGYNSIQAKIALKKEQEMIEERLKAEKEQRKKVEEFKKTLSKEEAEKEIAKLKEEAEADELSRSIDLVSIPTPEVKGITIYYSVEIIDKTKLPLKYLIPDEKTLNALARVEKENFKVAGCKLIKTEKIRG